MMTYRNWLDKTSRGLFKTRGHLLKNIDRAFEHYSRTNSNRHAISEELDKWIKSKGVNWRRDIRNKNFAIEELYNHFHPTQKYQTPQQYPIADQEAALKIVRAESAEILNFLFKKRRLESRLKIVHTIRHEKWKTIKNNPGKVYDISSIQQDIRNVIPRKQKGVTAAKNLISEISGPDIYTDVLIEINRLGLFGQVVASVIPFVGVMFSGGILANSIRKVICDHYRYEQFQKHLTFTPSIDEPEEAFRAMERILLRESHANNRSLALCAGEFSAKFIGCLLDGGTVSNAAIGLSSSLTGLIDTIYIISRDIREKKTANKAMKKNVDLSIFNTCPILGAYLVRYAPTSVLVNGMLDQIQISPNPDNLGNRLKWQKKVENIAINHLPSLRSIAQRAINSHRFHIVPAISYEKKI